MLAEVQWESVALVTAIGVMVVGVIKLFRNGKDPDAVIAMIESTAKNADKNTEAIGELTTNMAVVATKLDALGRAVDEVRSDVRSLKENR